MNNKTNINLPNILLIIPEYGHGGAQRVFAQLSHCLSKDFNVIKVVFNSDELSVYKSSGMSLSLDTKAGNNLIMKGFQFILRCWKLYKLKKRFNPKYTISHLEGANYINVLSGSRNSIVCIHGSKIAPDTNRKGFIKFVENSILTPVLYNRAHKIVTVSHEIARELALDFNIKENKLNTIYNGIDFSFITEEGSSKLNNIEQSLFSKKTLIFIGRLAPQKNPLALLDIYTELEDNDKINLLIVGNGPLKSAMIDKCIKNNLDYQDGLAGPIDKDATVFFLGFQDNPFKFLKHSTLFILTSEFEGFPLAPIEAMSLGIPVIVTDCPTGTREILMPLADLDIRGKISMPEYSDFGILMPLIRSNNINIWSNEISLRLNDSDWLKRISKQSQNRALELSLNNFCESWRALLENQGTETVLGDE